MLYLFVSLFASMIGAICGIGGGVIIKPVLDMVSNDPTSTINFLSGCAVLAMSAYSVIKAVINDAKAIDYTYMVPLAAGSAAGGLFGNALFGYVSAKFADPAVPRIMQSGFLAVMVFVSLIYTINKDRIRTKKVENQLVSVIVGFALGTMSSFLGIGGGPINLVVLYYFFSMTTKEAALSSIFIILFGQITNIGKTILSGAVPPLNTVSLILMMAGGIFGGIFGRKLNKTLTDSMVDKLFIFLMVVIIGICFFNIYKYIV